MNTYVKMMIFFIVFSFALASQAYGGTPLATVEEKVTAALDVLRDPAMQGDAVKNVKEKKIWTIADALFDYPELSKRALGKQWQKLNPEQQKEFTELFSTHLGNIYLDRIITYTGEKVVFTKEKRKKNKALVFTKIVTSTKEIPIDYRMLLKGDEWRVYDVVIEGVSLVKNYRSQFREMLKRKDPEHLLETLRGKVEKKT